MKRVKKFIFAFLVAFVGVLALTNSFSFGGVSYAKSLYSGEIANQVIFVTYEDGNEDWLNSSVSRYTQTPLTLMKNSYNDSTSSVENYYKVQSYNSLDLKSHFITNNGKAIKVPYTKNELLPYSKTNTDGYLEYEICTYSSSSAPAQLTTAYLTSTTYQFSCYDCENSAHDGSSASCDTDYSDGIACLCAYYSYAKTHSKVCYYEHLERYFREQISLRTAVNSATFEGNLDANGDGYVDAITFIFEGITDEVAWSSLLWAHQSALIDLSSLSSSKSQLPVLLSLHGVRDTSQSDFSTKLDTLLSNEEKDGKTCYSYNLYLFSHLLPHYSNGTNYAIKGNDGKEIVSNFTLTHELGHVLGLPDYYVYDDDEIEDPVDVWDVMGYSYYGVPTYMLTYSREKLGFLSSENIVKLTEESVYELYPTCYDEVNNNGNNSGNILAYVYEDEAHPGQKIYIEYRTQEGLFDSGLKTYYGSGYRDDGLIVYRVDENVKQVSGYSNGVASGNYYGYPHNVYVFRNEEEYAINEDNNVLNNITFQSYSSSYNQQQLTYDDVTFTNSGLKIEFVSVKNGKLSFKITGGSLEEERDISQIKLSGESVVTIEVHSAYIDAGIDYGEFSADEFNIVIDSKVNTSRLGEYTYTYLLTRKSNSSKSITLTRTVKVVDRTKPIVKLIGDSEVVVENIDDYVDQGIEYSDNYDSEEDLKVETARLPIIGEKNRYQIIYTVTDTSGNITQIIRYITVKPKTDFSSVKLSGGVTVEHEVNTTYVDAGIDYGKFSADEFNTIIDNKVNTSRLGEYTYVYSLIYTSTGESIALTRYVIVSDSTPPIVELVGESVVTVSRLSGYVDKGVTCSDNYDSAVNLNVKISVPTSFGDYYKIIYEVTDSSENSTLVERIIIVDPNLFASITLKGEANVEHDVNTSYVDAGISFGTFKESDFNIIKTNKVNEDVINSKNQSYTYVYNFTYLRTSEKFSITRYVHVVDRIAPTIWLTDDSEVEIFKSELESYKNKDIVVEDNYNSKNEITIISRYEKIDDETYCWFYKAKDTSGNESEEICRRFKIKDKPIIGSQITLKLDESEIVKDEYDAGKEIKFSVNIDLNEDNDPDQIIKFIVNGKVIRSGYETTFRYGFPEAGTYKVKIQVGDDGPYVEKTIRVVGKEEEEQVDNIFIYILAGCGGGLIIASIIALIVNKKKRIKDFDSY